jgi:NAD(P)-dependent dehydrogenase (short-subunit alcohol dehydrogenase family)
MRKQKKQINKPQKKIIAALTGREKLLPGARSNVGAALISGAAKRIGREISINLASQGYDIAISYNKSAAEAKELATLIKKNFSVRCEIFKSDLIKKDAAKNLARAVIEKFPHWNLLVNNASIFSKSEFLLAPDFELENNFNIHLLAPLILSKEFAGNVKKKSLKNAQIINMIDKNIMRFETSYFYYLLSKKFLAEFTKMLAVAIAPQIRVNAIAPGFILHNPAHEKKLFLATKNLTQKIPLKIKGDVKNICQAVEFLLKNNFVTGQILLIDGGAALNHAG